MTRRHANQLPPAPFARHEGRHRRPRRRWLDELCKPQPEPAAEPAPVDDFSRPRTAPVGLVPYPMAADLYPYNPLRRAS